MKNNKGFTLVELIIAISIMSMVIGLGYNIINKVNSATQDQNKVSENQLNANLINKYLTKDLESCKTFEGPEGTNLGQKYEFIINQGKNEVIYKVLTGKKGNQEIYNLTRSSNGSEIDLITNQVKVSEKPFFISKKVGYTDLYLVEFDSIKELSGKYQFEVASRVLVSSSEDKEIPVLSGTDDSDNPSEPIEPPITPGVVVPGKPEEEFTKDLFHTTRFWVEDSDNAKVEMGFSHSGSKKQNGTYESSKNVDYNQDNRYAISMEMFISNSSVHDYMSIDNGSKKLESNKDIQVQNLGKGQDLIVIEVKEGTVLELEVNDTFIVPNVSSGEKIILKNGKYKYALKANVKTFIVTGNIIKNTQNAEVKVYYGQKKK